jgi:hypothetical protein
LNFFVYEARIEKSGPESRPAIQMKNQNEAEAWSSLEHEQILVPDVAVKTARNITACTTDHSRTVNSPMLLISRHQAVRTGLINEWPVRIMSHDV